MLWYVYDETPHDSDAPKLYAPKDPETGELGWQTAEEASDYANAIKPEEGSAVVVALTVVDV